MSKLRLLCLCFLSGIVVAEGGFYMGIGAGYADVTNTAQSPFQFSNSSTSLSGGSFASTLYAGYDFYRWLGIQIDYNAAWGAGFNNGSSLNQQLIGASLLFHLPFGIMSTALNGLSAYAKVGYDYNAVNFGGTNTGCSSCTNTLPSSSYGYTPLYGLGVEYGFKNIGYRLEWDYSGNLNAQNNGTNVVNTSSNSYLVSILYHF